MNTSSGSSDDFGSAITNTLDRLLWLPLRATDATLDAMLDSLRWMNGAFQGTSPRTLFSRSGGSLDEQSIPSASAGRSGPSWISVLTGHADQDLGGDDLKYVVWSMVFTKPGLETVLEPQHEEIVNYAADVSAFSAVKIANFLEHARHGRVDKPKLWIERSYPPEVHGTKRPEAAPLSGVRPEHTERGWRIPAEDQRYLTLLYRVERRLPRQTADAARTDRVATHRDDSAVA